MILTCNSCEKKFVVPDQAIKASGRIVQCGSCGNKWKQFPINGEINKPKLDREIGSKKTQRATKAPKFKNKRITKNREIGLYSPEYLKKKHGITLKEAKVNINNTYNEKVSFGFYNLLILYIVIIIAVSKFLHFSQHFIVQKLPFTEFYLDYFFENIKNIYEIGKNLITNY